MPLILPSHQSNQNASATPPIVMGLFLSSRELGGKPATTADLVAELVQLKRSDVVRWVAAMSLTLEDPGVQDHQRQWQMAKQLLSAEKLTGLRTWIETGQQWNWAIFHERQLWLLLQFALIACKEETEAVDAAALAMAIGRASIAVNDILHVIEPQQDAEQWQADYHHCFVANMVGLIGPTNQMEILARAHKFWFDLPKSPSIIQRFKHSKAPDFASAFQAKYSQSLEQFFIIALSVWSAFFNQARTTRSPLLLDPQQNLIPHFGEDVTTQALSIFSQSPDDLIRKLLGKPRQNWATDATFLKQTPLIEILPGRHACPDISTLHAYLTDGIYFLLHDAYPGDRFRELFGYVFEAYVNLVLGEFTTQSDTLRRTFWPSPKLVGTTDQACDGLLHDDDFALVMEYKARLLTTRENYAGDPRATWNGIADIVAKNVSTGKKGAFQLASNIGRMLKGESIISGGTQFQATNRTRIIPALVTNEFITSFGAVRRWADARFRDALAKEGADTAQLGPLLILTIHDVERLEALSHKNRWLDVVRGFAQYIESHPDDPIATFDVSTSKANFRAEDPGSSFLSKQFANSLDFAVQRLPKSAFDQLADGQPGG